MVVPLDQGERHPGIVISSKDNRGPALCSNEQPSENFGALHRFFRTGISFEVAKDVW